MNTHRLKGTNPSREVFSVKYHASTWLIHHCLYSDYTLFLKFDFFCKRQGTIFRTECYKKFVVFFSHKGQQTNSNTGRFTLTGKYSFVKYQFHTGNAQDGPLVSDTFIGNLLFPF